jgi:hypothetical protein
MSSAHDHSVLLLSILFLTPQERFINCVEIILDYRGLAFPATELSLSQHALRNDKKVKLP